MLIYENTPSPFRAIMEKMSFFQKFFLIWLLILSSNGFLLWFLVGNANEQIAFSEKEVVGVEYLMPLKKVIITLQKIRGLTNAYLNGNESVSQRLDSLKREIGEELNLVVSVNSRYGEALQVGSRFTNISNEIDELNRRSLSMGATDAFSSYTDLIEKILALYVKVGDNSNLILDPDLDSFYLMDAVVNKIPRLIEEIGKARGLGAGVVAARELDKQKYSRLLTFQQSIVINARIMFSGFESAANYNRDLEKRLDSIRREVEKGINDYISVIESELLQEKFKISSSDYFNQGTELIGLLEKLYMASSEDLTGLLSARINRLKNELYTQVAVLLFSFFLLALFFDGTYKSIIRAVNITRDTLAKMANERDLTQKIDIDTRDELKLISDSINIFVDKVRQVFARFNASTEDNAALATELEAISSNIGKNIIESVQSVSKVSMDGSEIKSLMTDSVDQAKAANDSIQESVEELVEGKKNIDRFVGSMQTTAAAEQEMAQKVQRLSEEASQVTSVLGLISEIADQTNLLALNAAIEAARAGEQGRGFAVVADEVRNLAAKTQSSLKEINESINAIVGAINETSNQINENADKIAAIANSSTETGSQMSAIAEKMSGLSESNRQNVQAYIETAGKLGEMVSQLEMANSLSSQNEGAINEIIGAVNNLSRSVHTLKIDIDGFRL